VKLRDAFSILQPNDATYAALKQARERFLTAHDDPRLQQIGRQAYKALLEREIFWFCDFPKYQARSEDIVSQIQAMLQRVDTLDDLECRMSGIRIEVTTQNGTGPDLAALGFTQHQKTQVWRWQPEYSDPSGWANF
jgi:hypothetical protein